MATNKAESFWEKVREFWTQHRDDRAYERRGGDDQVPAEHRTADPRRDAREYARAHGENDPYPEDGPLPDTGKAQNE